MTVSPVVIGLGELLWDDFPTGRRPGGAPANCAFQASQLGAVGVVASRVGQDADGEELVRYLTSQGVETRLIQRDPHLPTGRVSVEVSSDGQPSYIIHQQVAWEALAPEANLLAAMKSAAAVCFGTLAQRGAESRRTIQQCLREVGPQTLVVYDVNLRQQWYERDWIERSLEQSQVLKLNDDELRVLAELLETGEPNLPGFAAVLAQRYGVQTTVLTRGARGCQVYCEGDLVDVPGEPVRVVDTVGAGDAFTAAFIMGRLWGWSTERTAKFANRIGGLVASRPGAMSPIAEEAAKLKVQE